MKSSALVILFAAVFGLFALAALAAGAMGCASPGGISSGGSSTGAPQTAAPASGASASAASASAGPASPAREVPPLRRPRDREYDVLSYRLTIGADLETKTVAGEAEITLVPVRLPLEAVRLDAAEVMTVSRVRVDGAERTFRRSGDTLEIPLAKPAAGPESLVVRVDYSVTAPPKGLYFSGPDESEPAKPWQLYTQGETEENRYWFPCYDYPSDKAVSEMIVTVDARFTAISNGLLLGVETAAGGAKRTFHWKQSRPHVSYLVSLVVGEYRLIEDRWRDVPVMNYVYAANAADAPRSFGKTPAMMEYFSEITGVPYPWEKYGHAIVQDFIFAGQENVTISTLTDNTIHDARAHLDWNSDGLVAHELAHQWYGDLVSFRDWSEVWLSEGFATYLTLLSEGKINGGDEFSYQLWQTQNDVTTSDVGDRRRPTVTKRYRDPSNLFDNRIYGKGGCVLHMLRSVLGDSMFFRGLRAYTAQYAWKSAETNQFRLAMEEATGRNLDWFFEQWVYGAGYPKFEISQRWDQASRSVSVTVRQTQQRDSLTGIFTVPVDILVWVGDDPEVHTETIADSVQTFTYPAYREPRLVIFDNGGAVLKTAKFDKPREQWITQLLDAGHAADRAAAVHELRWTVDTPAVREALVRAMLEDRFWGVRHEAALALADSKAPGGPPAAALVQAYGDRDARVRSAVMRALANCRGPEVVRTLRHAFDADSSYSVAAHAVRGLVKSDSAGSLDVCLEAIGRESQGDQVRSAGLRWLATYSGVPRALDTLRAWTGPGRDHAMRALAVSLIARHWPAPVGSKHAAALLDDPAVRVRRAAIDALAAEGGDESLESLRKRAEVERNLRLQERLTEAIRNLEEKHK